MDNKIFVSIDARCNHENFFILFTTKTGKRNCEMSLPLRTPAENSNSSRF